MAMKLLPESEGFAVVAGSIQQLSEELYKEYQLSGYSILLDDIVKAFLDETKYYAGWAVLDCQTKATTSIELNETIELSGDEYVIIQPLVKAHCDLLQARLVEATRGLGVESYGLSVSEAQQNYNEKKDALPKLVFCMAPISFNFNFIVSISFLTNPSALLIDFKEPEDNNLSLPSILFRSIAFVLSRASMNFLDSYIIALPVDG